MLDADAALLADVDTGGGRSPRVNEWPGKKSNLLPFRPVPEASSCPTRGETARGALSILGETGPR